MIKTKQKKDKQEQNSAYTQELVPVKDINGPIIRLLDGRYVGIMEVMPINFWQKMPKEQNQIINSFQRLFKICPGRMQFKTITKRIDTSEMVRILREKNRRETNPKICKALDDYIEQIKRIGGNAGIYKQYFIIFQYEGNAEGERNTKFEDVYNDMIGTYYHIKQVIEDTGNMVTQSTQNETYHTMQILYEFFNRTSSQTESYLNRYIRVNNDRNIYYEDIGKKMPPVDVADYIAPRSADFRSNKDFCCVDGMYYTYLAITDDGYPSNVCPAWMDVLFGKYGVGVDVDFIIKRFNHDVTKYTVDKAVSMNRVSAMEKQRDAMKFQSLMSRVKNGQYIGSAMAAGEDLYNCSTIVTIWGKDPHEIMQKRLNIMADVKSKSVKMEYSHLDCLRYFKMTSPFLNIQSEIMRRTGHNFLTSTLPSIYNYTTFQLFDPNGYMFGVNMNNGALVAINNFNTKIYKNGNMLILGTTGAGKSFTEMFIGRKQFFAGIRTYYILPEKGYEYRDACESLNGTYIKLQPGASECINIMEIRPEMTFNGNDVDADDEVMRSQSQSLLAKKITSLTIWIELLLPEGDAKINSIEMNKLNIALAKLYNRYGITDDNDSIFEEDGKTLKTMPIISDLYDVLHNDPGLDRLSAVLLPFIEGSCRNMNAQTNVNLDNRCIVFDVDEAVVGENMLAAFLYIAFDCAYDLVKADVNGFDTIILDEVWKMMNNEACAKQVQKLVKLIRGYAGAVIIATQDLHDFLNAKGGFGTAVINNTKIKFIMQLENDELERVADLMKLTDNDCETINKFPRGCGMLFSNTNKVNVKVEASDLEIYTFTTDLNVKRKFMAQEKAQKEEKKRAQQSKQEAKRRVARPSATQNEGKRRRTG